MAESKRTILYERNQLMKKARRAKDIGDLESFKKYSKEAHSLFIKSQKMEDDVDDFPIY
jgi:hypothetical protein